MPALALAGLLLPVPPGVVERWYSRGVYPVLQSLVTPASSLSPVALLDVAALAGLIWFLAAALRSWRSTPVRRWLATTARVLLVAAAVLYLWFLVFWGLNYRRVPLEQKLAYEQARVGRDSAVWLAEIAVDQANALAASPVPIVPDDGALVQALADVEGSLGSARIPVVARPKRSLLTWYFRAAAIDGMTNPFFLEIILNPDLLPAERPFTLAHEWAHLAGYADESEANFVAWLTCIRAGTDARYSGWLAAYRYLAGPLPPDDRKRVRSRLSAVVAADLAAINERLARANPTVAHAARDAYDKYLRANRIEEGIANYGLVARLMLGTAFDENWRPRLRGTGSR